MMLVLWTSIPRQTKGSSTERSSKATPASTRSVGGSCCSSASPKSSPKMYDKFGLLLRVATTVNDLTFFQHYRQVEQRDGRRVRKWAEMKRNIYSLPILRERCLAANWRYLESLCALADPTAGMHQLQRITQPVQQHHRTYRGFDFFSAQDQPMLLTLLRGEFTIRGFANKDLRRDLPGKT